ncbi:hypothetical protein D1871_19710 [Nakamurella silvestris]|nr:hypothetical protein D1871_19710 [Nakamurella silvestris]
MSNPIVEFLYDVLDETFRVAANAGAEAWSAEEFGGTTLIVTSDDRDPIPFARLMSSEWDEAAHITMHDPASVLAQVRAQRELVSTLDSLIITADLVLEDPVASSLV